MIAFDDDMELDTVSKTECGVKFGLWMRRWREAKSLVENVDVEPDHYMFRLWLGVLSVATQNRLKPDEFEYMFHMLRLHGFADAHTAPRGESFT
jgi:hypothetical protein